MPLVLAGATSGSTTIQATDAVTQTITLPNNSGTVLTTNGSGIASVNGIQFPATQSPSADANTLDDYEEGTWTPIYVQSTTNPTVTYSNTIGSYRKIGSFVYVTGRISTNSVSGGSGNISIGGLPFTVANLAQDNGSFNVGVSFSWPTNSFPSAGFASRSTTSVILATGNSADARSGVDARLSTFSSGSGSNGIVFSCCYIATD